MFREIARQSDAILYTADNLKLTLEGHLAGESTSWTLTASDGERRQFDDRGLLVRWADGNDIGLTLAWAEGSGRLDWRLASVTDSVGRTVTYHYDGQDRLLLVHESTSDLEASYVYDDRSDLVVATSSSGRSEAYEYDHASGRVRGDWASEWLLADACELACAPSTSSCSAGGACDAPVESAMGQCLGSCAECSTECREQCPSACGDACRGDSQTPGCVALCQGDCQAGTFDQAIEDTCQAAWDDFGAEVCGTCSKVCDREGSTCHALANCVQQASYEMADNGNTVVNIALASECFDLQGLGVVGDLIIDFAVGSIMGAFDLLSCGVSAVVCSWNPWCEVDCGLENLVNGYEELCNQHYDTCCEDGVECGPAACNDGHSCEDDCRAVFFGQANGNVCASFASGGVPVGAPDFVATFGTPEYDQLVAYLGTVDDWATTYGCLPALHASCGSICSSSCVGECAGECIPACGDDCDSACNLDDCAGFCDSLDLMGQCQDSCVTGCIDTAHQAGPFVGAKYGHPADLNHNLVRIYDSNGDLYLENVYDDDLSSPSHDSVVVQYYGEHPVELAYRDLRAEASGAIAPPSGPAAAFSVSLEDFESVDICPGDCASSGQPDEVVPWRDLVLVFEQPAGHSTGGLPVRSRHTSGEVIPTGFDLSRVSNGVLAIPFGGPAISPRRISISTSGGAVELARRSDGSYLGTGSSAAQKALLALRQLTILTDRQGSLRVYPGVPRGALHVSAGSCDRPFVVRPAGQTEIELEPVDACSETVMVAPLASLVRDRGLASGLQRDGGGHLVGRNLYLGSVMAPSRQVRVWSQGSTTGRFGSSRTSIRSSATTTRDLALAFFDLAPLVNGWVRSSRAPVYAFHVAPESGPTTLPGRDPGTVIDPVLPTDDPFVPPDEFYEPLCDPGIPLPARRGTGAGAPGQKPARASVLIDFHGTPWTYYFDAGGRLLRLVNHDTAAVRSYNYDAGGELSGYEDPVRGRTCIDRDQVGNPTKVTSLPAPGHLGTSQPIVARYSYTPFPHQLHKVWDPRSGGQTALMSYQWDAQGNLLGATDAAGDTISIDLVGGAGPDRAMPGWIIGPDGSATAYEYDVGSGTVEQVVLDAGGPAATTTETVHDAAGRPVWASTPLGEIITWEWQQGRLHAQTRNADGLFEFVEFDHDDDGQVTSINRGDRLSTLTYDTIGNVRTITEAALDGSGLSRTTCLLTGPNRRPLEVVQPEGTRIRFSYDGEGRRTLVEAGSWAESGQGWDDACPAQLGDLAPASGVIHEATYDIAGRPLVMRDATGIPTSFRHDGLGRTVEIKRATLVARRDHDELGNVTWQAAYDAAQAPGSFGAPWSGQAGLLAADERWYDAIGRPERIDTWHLDDQGQPVGDGISRALYAYDIAGRQLTVTDDAGSQTTTEYDPLGRPVRQLLGNGAEILSQYADGGRTVTTKQPAPTPTGLDVTTMHYTPWGAPSTMLAGDGQTAAKVATWGYDDHRRPILAWSISGGTRSYEYDAFDRLTREELRHDEQSSEVIRYAWDRNDWLRGRHSDGGTIEATTAFYRDALGRVRHQIDPDGAQTQIFYDGADASPSVVLDAAGFAHHHAYDAAGNLARLRTVAPVTGDLEHWREYIHDPLGRLVEAFDQKAPEWSGDEIRTHLRWDSLGNKIAEWDTSFGVSGGVAHGYDGRGLAVDSTIVGLATHRGYDSLGRLTTVHVGTDATPGVELEWGALGPPLQLGLGNGIVTTYEYDSYSRLIGQSDTRAGDLVAQLAWDVPLDGAPRFDSFYGLGLAEDASAYLADDSGRLRLEAHGLGSPTIAPLSASASTQEANEWAAQLLGGASSLHEYDLDGRHNWTSVTGTSPALTPTVGPADTYEQLGGVAATYDARGALLAAGNSSFRYNAFGELRAVYGLEASREYRRDALGRIVRELDPVTGEVTRIAHDGARRVALRHPDGGIERFVDGPALDQHLLRIRPDGARDYFHQDRIGNVYLLTDAAGSPLEWYRYSGYGEATILAPDGQPLAASAIGNRFTFQGQLADHQTGLLDMRARAYLPTWGRFLTRDPIGLLGGTNLYAFVGGAPQLWTDPLGLRKGQAYDLCQTDCHPESFTVRRDREASNARFRAGVRTPMPTRLVGVFRVLGAFAEASAGVGLMLVPGGQVAGFLLILHAADGGAAGVSQSITGKHTRTFSSHGLQHWSGVSPETADTMDGLITGGAGLAGWYRLIRQPVPAPTIVHSTAPSLPTGTALDETVDLYRAVGAREFESIAATGKFLPGSNSLEGRQFVFTFDEALSYANVDPSKVAILRVTVGRDVLRVLDYSNRIDPHLFINGVITVQPGSQSTLFHLAIQALEHVF